MKAICIYTTSKEFECPFRGIKLLEDVDRPEEALDEVANAYFFMEPDVAAKLQKTEFPETGDEDCEIEIGKFMLHICKQFEIKEESLEEVLRSLNSESIVEALDKGWKPKDFKKTLEAVLQSYESEVLAETLRFELTRDADISIRKAIGWTETWYESYAERYLDLLGLDEQKQRVKAIVQEYFEGHKEE